MDITKHIFKFGDKEGRKEEGERESSAPGDDCIEMDMSERKRSESVSSVVKEKVMRDVSKSLNVRVKAVRKTRSGGVAIETVSESELKRLTECAKFGDVGLKVEMPRKIGPKVIVYDVPNELTNDDLMKEMYEKNLKGRVNECEFRERVRIGNCQRAYAVMCDLGELLCERRVSVALLQEPYVRDGRVTGLPVSMDVVVCESDSIKAAVVVNDSKLDEMCVRECTNEYGVCVWLKGGFGEMYVVSVYCQYGKSIEPYLAYMDSVCEVARGKCLLVGMDANDVSPLWYSKGEGGSRDRELRGRVLEEWIVANGMNVLNEPSDFYTFSGPNGESDIDVTLVNDACVGCRFEWDIKHDWGISDHNVLLIRMLYGEDAGANDDVCRWIWKGADWEGYMCDLRESASENAASAMDVMDAEKLVELVMSWIRIANDRRMRRFECKNRRKLVWWSDELERMKKSVRRCRRAYQRARKGDRRRADERANEYKRALYEYKKEMWRIKEENWREFVSVTGNRDPWGDVYKVCMGKRGRVRLSGMKVGDRTTMRTDERQFEWSEVSEAVKSMKVGKAPGLDGVCTEMLRAIWRAIPEWLKRVYDVCLSTMRFPSAWKSARVIVLLKSPEKVRSDPGSYRPICLLSVLGKVLERMMVKRLERLVSERLCDAQYGFVRGRSTEGAWNRVQEWVSGSESKYVLGVFVDFQGAFDNLEWDCVIQKLREIGCEEIGLWESYFRRNRVELERKGTEWMKMVYEWGVRVGVSVSESKTVLMFMKGGMAGKRHPSVRVNGRSVKYASCVKYLGVWRVVLSACLNVCRTVSTAAMQVLMGGLPWDLECVRRGVCYKIKNGLSMSEHNVVSDDDLREKSVDECVRMVSDRLYEVWQKRWDECENGRVTYEFIKNVRFAEECSMFEPSLWLGFILTGHGSLNGFLYERGLSKYESCACGAECEDWKHVLVECPLYEDVRNLCEWGVTVREDEEKKPEMSSKTEVPEERYTNTGDCRDPKLVVALVTKIRPVILTGTTGAGLPRGIRPPSWQLALDSWW
ncbi:reverse [Lasius niger]|uniref:Reverse n=1 Tax=Lasius niger TaxID=67767 RepID=A0A0J7KFH6_LASNI|nr:reverse [Lasius niger]